MNRNITLLLSLLLTSASASADVVRTVDGAQLTGTITLIDQGVIHLETDYAGTLKIQQDQVESFESAQPRVLRLESGTIMAGEITGGKQGELRVRSEDGTLETSTEKVAAAWSPESEDPEVARNRREWRYEASLNLSGKSGNSDYFRLGSSFNAELKGPNDTLAFTLEFEQEEENGNDTEDRALASSSYESFFSEKFGWYVRTELETDRIDNIDFRSTSAFGLSYRLIDKEHQTLVSRTGLGYRYTSYEDGSENESSATLDFGLAHSYRFNDTFIMKNELTLVPAIEDFSNYRAVHDSGIEVPIGSGENWKIRMGIRNEYENETTADKKLDTSYYTKMVYSWN